MRETAEQDHVSVKAYAGTTGVLLAMNVPDARREDLLGFAIHRAGGDKPAEWLNGMISFPGVEHKPGEPLSTEQAPIQKFRGPTTASTRTRPTSTRSTRCAGSRSRPRSRPGPRSR